MMTDFLGHKHRKRGLSPGGKPVGWGKSAIKAIFSAEMAYIVEDIFEDGQWAILEWRDPLGLRPLL